MTNNISIRHLRAFIAIAASGSFTRAASSLHLTQSSLTATIKQLEEQAGLKLLDRTTRSVLLTHAGSNFLPIAQKLVSDFDTAFSDLKASASQQQGQVGIAASPSMLSQILPPVVSHYHQQFPKMGIYLRDDNAGGIERRVHDNEVDFGIGGNHSHHAELNYRPVLSDRYGLIVPCHHPLAGQAQCTWANIINLPQLQLTEDSGTYAQLHSLALEYGLSLPMQGTRIEVSTPSGLAQMIKTGLGVTILPALAASTDSFTQLRFIPLTEPHLEREIAIITRKGRSLTPAAETLLAMLNQHFHSTALPQHVRIMT